MTAPGLQAPAKRHAGALRFAVAAWGLVGVVAFAVSLPNAYAVRATVCATQDCPPGSLPAEAAARMLQLGISPELAATVGLSAVTIIATTCFVVGALLLRWGGRRPDVAAGAFGLFTIGLAFPQTVAAAASDGGAWLGVWFESVTFAGFAVWMLTFPDARLRARFSVLPLAALLAFTVALPLTPPPYTVIVLALGGLALIAASADLIARLVTTPDAADRRGIRLVLIAFCAALVALALGGLLQAMVFPRGSIGDFAVQAVVAAAFLSIPTAIGLAVLSRGLWDPHGSTIRALAAGGVAALLLAGGAVAAMAAMAVGVEPSVALVVIAALAAIIAVPAFDAMRALLRRLAGAGARDPDTALDRLTASLAPVTDPSRLGATAVETICAAFGLSSVELIPADPVLPAARWGDATGGATGAVTFDVALEHRARNVGILRIHRARHGDLVEGERREIVRIAAVVAAALHSAGRDLELRAAHARLITAQEDERRRIRNELHDELGPRLGGVILQLGAAEHRLDGRPDAARELLASSRASLETAVGSLRELVYGLRPPALDSRGLVAAIAAFAETVAPGGFEVRLVDAVSVRLPSAVEVVAYRVAVESIANAIRHSGVLACTVALSSEEAPDRLSLTIGDAGTGGPIVPGVGIGSMRERVAEVGGEFRIGRTAAGGVEVHVELPLLPGDHDAAESTSGALA